MGFGPLSSPGRWLSLYASRALQPRVVSDLPRATAFYFLSCVCEASKFSSSKTVTRDVSDKEKRRQAGWRYCQSPDVSYTGWGCAMCFQRCPTQVCMFCSHLPSSHLALYPPYLLFNEMTLQTKQVAIRPHHWSALPQWHQTGLIVTARCI